MHRTVGVHITVNGKECINLATYNFLGFLGNTAIKVHPHPEIKLGELSKLYFTDFDFLFSL